MLLFLVSLVNYAAGSFHLNPVSFNGVSTFKHDAPKFVNLDGVEVGDEVTASGTALYNGVEYYCEASASLFLVDDKGKFEVGLTAMGLGAVYIFTDDRLIMPEQALKGSLYQGGTCQVEKPVSLLFFMRSPDSNRRQVHAALQKAINSCQAPQSAECLVRSSDGHLLFAHAPLTIKARMRPKHAIRTYRIPTLYDRHDMAKRFEQAWDERDIAEMMRILRMPPQITKSINLKYLDEHIQFPMASLLGVREWRTWLNLTRQLYPTAWLEKKWLDLLLYLLDPRHERGRRIDVVLNPMTWHFQATMQEFRDLDISPASHQRLLEAILEASKDSPVLLRMWFQLYASDSQLCTRVSRLGQIGEYSWARGDMCGWRVLHGTQSLGSCHLSLRDWDAMLRILGGMEEEARLDHQLWWKIRDSLAPLTLTNLIVDCLNENLIHMLIVLLRLAPPIVWWHTVEINYLTIRQLLILLKYGPTMKEDFLEQASKLSLAHAFVIRFHRRYGAQAGQAHIEINLQELEQMMEPTEEEVKETRKDLLLESEEGKITALVTARMLVGLYEGILVVPATMAYLLTDMTIDQVGQFSDDEEWERADLISMVNWRNRHYCLLRGNKEPRTILHGFDPHWERIKREEVQAAFQRRLESILTSTELTPSAFHRLHQ